MDNIIDMKAGDILFSRRKSAPSGLIRFFTLNDWSHVAIATSSNCVLEATQEKGVDDIFLKDFLDENDSVILFRRSLEDALSAAQKEELKAFVPLMKEKKYTVLHAGFTFFPKLIFMLIFAAILFPVFGLVDMLKFLVISIVTLVSVSIWSSRIHICIPISEGWFRKICLVIAAVAILYLAVDLFIHIQTVSLTYFIAWMVWSTFCGLWGGAFIWFLRTQLGVATTEKLYCKTRWGRVLVRKKYDMFCSRLVLKADIAIEGPLAAHTLGEMEVQPVHIFKACQKLWGEGSLIKGENAQLYNKQSTYKQLR